MAACINLTLNYFRLYVPTVLVVGLHGWILPPSLIVVCDMFVYSEFLIHPVMLLTTSSKLRAEISEEMRAKYLVKHVNNSNTKFLMLHKRIVPLV